MALEITHSITVHGKELSFERAYCKITYQAGDKEQVDFTLTIMDEQKINVFEHKSYSFVPSVEEGSENFIKQMYEHLKTLPEFAEAIDR